ncbi:PP2C protein phosphatase 2C [Cryptosporidium ubiquitum]|uniref:PP2C protein phosphatase 2C n=1 Tax=Cryptosporidium ubiquitum TaxID=857276 RepID=A0A1J4MC64_9CRYT|nr:PP2C protein phosphatase 2C [Cryptosporidium ubiquitum]OII71798.1 PP2C protein phosphatase 2C [Cryptosporidium ubiquitum]
MVHMYNYSNQSISCKGKLALSGGHLSTLCTKNSAPSPSYIIGPSKQSATISGRNRLNSSLGPPLTNFASFIHRRAGRISRSPSPVRGNINSKENQNSKVELSTEKSSKELSKDVKPLLSFGGQIGNAEHEHFCGSFYNGIKAAKQIGESAICNEKSIYEENRELKKQISELKEAIICKEGENQMLRLKLELFYKEIIKFSSVSLQGRESLPPLKVKTRNKESTNKQVDEDLFDFYVCGDYSNDENEVFSKKKCIWKPSEELARKFLKQMKINFICVKGKRINRTMVNQDDFCIVKLTNNSLIIGVFDGHGRYGHKVAAIVRQRVVKGIQNIFFGKGFQLEENDKISNVSRDNNFNSVQKTSQEKINISIFKIFESIQNYLEKEGSFGTSGTSVTFTIINSDSIIMVQLGSSGGIIIDSKTGNKIYSTPRHDLSNLQEKERIIGNGAIVNENNRFSLNRIEEKKLFSITRSLGDLDGKALGILNKPEVWEMKIEKGNSVKIILATDGFLKYSDEIKMDYNQLCIEKELDSAVKKCQGFWLNSTNNTSVDDITVVSCNILN